MRTVSLLLAFSLSLFGQSVIQKLAAPVELELGIQPAWQSNPLNLSELEIEKAANETGYLGDVEFSESRVISVYGKLSYDPRLYGERKTAIDLNTFYHSYLDIPQRDYSSLSLSIRQALGNWRFTEIGYGLLPSLYLRHYYFKGSGAITPGRYACHFGTERGWLEYQHRIGEATSLSYRVTRRIERYKEPFAHYDMLMWEAATRIRMKPLRAVSLNLELRYGDASNDNHIDDLDRSYHYLNIRPSMSLPIPGEYLRSLRIDGRFDQRAYLSDETTDPLHAGRYQYEYRIDMQLFPEQNGALVWHPFFGYRQRVVESESDYVTDLKSFQRWWFGIRVGFNSVIDMYL